MLTEAQWDVLLRQTRFSGLDGSLPDNVDNPVEPALGAVIFPTATNGHYKRYPEASLLLTKRSQNSKMEILQ